MEINTDTYYNSGDGVFLPKGTTRKQYDSWKFQQGVRDWMLVFVVFGVPLLLCVGTLIYVNFFLVK